LRCSTKWLTTSNTEVRSDAATSGIYYVGVGEFGSELDHEPKLQKNK
jgi:hypothetical protein